MHFQRPIHLILLCLSSLLISTSAQYSLPGDYMNIGGSYLRRDPGFKARPHASPKPLDEVTYYGCPPRVANPLKSAITDTAAASAFLRDVLYDTAGNKSSAAMLDYIYNSAFTKANDAAGNQYYVRAALRFMAQGVAVNPDNPSETAPLRIACIPAELKGDFGKIAATASQHDAIVFVTPRFYESLGEDKDDESNWAMLCGDVAFNKHLELVATMAHEMSHTAGVHAKNGVEVYDKKEAFKLKPDYAINNSQNFGWAVAMHLGGCARKYFSKADEGDADQNYDHMRKALTVTDGFPNGHESNTTDLSKTSGAGAGFETAEPKDPHAVVEALYDKLEIVDKPPK